MKIFARGQRWGVVTFLAVAFAAAALAEPKAYDLVKYRGKAAGLTIAFDFGDRYPAASELRIAEGHERKSTRFVLDGENLDESTMRFVPEKDRNGGREVVLKMSADAAAPPEIEGTYRAGGKAIPFALKQR